MRRAASVLVAALALLLVGCDRTRPAPTAGATSASTPSATASASATPTVRATATSFAGVPAPTTWEPDSLAPIAMSAPGRDTVWALLNSIAGPALFRSTNRGDTWESRGMPPAAARADLTFIDDREGWLAADGVTSARCPQATLVLWHTRDAGDTWTAATTATADGPLCRGVVSFVDAKRRFLGGTAANGGAVLYRTTDAGARWTVVDGAPSLSSVRAVDAALLGVGALPGALGPGKRLVARSTDGATWARLAEVDTSVGIVTASRWIVLGGPGGFIETVDSGATWHPFDTDYGQASPVAPVVLFGDAAVGYATTRSTIQRTTDGGAHWSRIPTPGRR